MPFTKGDKNINRKGRPKGTQSLTTLVREALQNMKTNEGTSYETLLTQRVMKKAIEEGDMQAIKLIWNYLDGLPAQPIEGTDRPIMIQVSQQGAKKYGLNISTEDETE